MNKIFELKTQSMKYGLILLVTFFVSTTNTLFAQEEITDEDLKKYAVTMDSIDNMKQALLEDISEMVKSNEEMSNERYNELSKIIRDDAKLAEAEATPEEVNFIKSVAAKKSEGTKEISSTFQTLAKEYIGAAEYNRVKKALKTDAELKTKYMAYRTELRGEPEGEDEGETASAN
jgi:hypothetical protein